MNREVYDSILQQYGKKIADAFNSAIEAMRSKVILQEVINDLERGDINSAVDKLKIEPAAFFVYEEAISSAFYTAGSMSGIANIKLLFNMRNYRAEQWLKDKSSQLIVEIIEPQKEMVRAVMIDGLSQGLNPRTIALNIVGKINPDTKKREGGILGLYEQQRQYVENAKEELKTLDRSYFTRKLRDKRFDSVVRKAIKDNEPLGADKVDEITNRYTQRLLKYRGNAIGRTEALSAINAAEYESFKQALEKSNYSDDMVTNTWESAHDSRVRHTHTVLNGKKTQGMETPFISPSGAKMRYPTDRLYGAPTSEVINCRCRVIRTIDYLGRFKNV